MLFSRESFHFLSDVLSCGPCLFLFYFFFHIITTEGGAGGRNEGGGGSSYDQDVDIANDDAYFSAVSPGMQHASIKSYFLRCLPNRRGHQRTFFWEAFMFLLEIPPHLEKNIYRKVKKMTDKSRLPTAQDVPAMAKAYLYTPRLPCLEWGKDYRHRKDLIIGDLMAGLTIGVMLIPQSMAYALLSNLPPIMGLYTACIAPMLYAAFGTSKHLQIGPTSLVRILFSVIFLPPSSSVNNRK